MIYILFHPIYIHSVPPEIHTFWSYQDEIAFIDRIVYGGLHIIVPASLHQEVL